jgi:hypothetical protein
MTLYVITVVNKSNLLLVLRKVVNAVSEYNLSFFAAVEICLTENSFIRGENFQEGYYAKNSDGVIVLVNGSAYHDIQGNLMISEGLLKQKFKSFSIANHKNIGLR